VETGGRARERIERERERGSTLRLRTEEPCVRTPKVLTVLSRSALTEGCWTDRVKSETATTRKSLSPSRSLPRLSLCLSLALALALSRSRALSLSPPLPPSPPPLTPPCILSRVWQGAYEAPRLGPEGLADGIRSSASLSYMQAYSYTHTQIVGKGSGGAACSARSCGALRGRVCGAKVERYFVSGRVPQVHVSDRQKFSKALSPVPNCSTSTRPLTFENMCNRRT
jgi:hypothetical protein